MLIFYTIIAFLPFSFVLTLYSYMDNVIKISLTIQLEGSTLVRKSEPEVINYSITKKNKKTKKNHSVVKKEAHSHYSLEAKPAVLQVNMGVEAYNYMISSECPSFAKPKVWFKMNETERLNAHLQRICEHHRGKSFTYVVLED